MQKTILGIVFAIFYIITTTSTLQAQAKRSLFADVRASRVGDVITIIIDENTRSTNRAQTQTQKSENLSISSEAGTGPLDFIPGFGITNQSSNQFQGQGLTTTQGQFTTTMTAVVEKVLENGNLLIRGVQEVDTNGEKQVTIIEGMIRPEDISQNNTISSLLIANKSIYYHGKGVVHEGNRPGIFTRILNWIF